VQIMNHRPTERSVPFGIAHNRRRTANTFDNRSDMRAQQTTAKGQQRLIGTHAARMAAGEHETGNRQLAHRVPLAVHTVAAIIKANTFMRVSLVTAAMALTALAAGPARAARPSLVPRSATHPTSVVRLSPQGKLVRSIMTPAAPAVQVTTPANIDLLVNELAAEHQVDPWLVHAVIRVESNYNQFAMSDKGAQGYMQLIPQTARQMGVGNAFDPRENIRGGVKYLRAMMDRFPDLRHAIAAYNAGPEAVQRFGGIPPYAETQNYVWLVADQYNRLRREHPAVAQQIAAAQPAPEPEHRPLVVYTDAEGRTHFETQ
jgi:Transglycosylase SLT domain